MELSYEVNGNLIQLHIQFIDQNKFSREDLIQDKAGIRELPVLVHVSTNNRRVLNELNIM